MALEEQAYCGCADYLRDANLQRKANNREPIRIGVQYYGQTSFDDEKHDN